MNKIPNVPVSSKLGAWTSNSHERFLVTIVVIVTVVLCILLFIVPTQSNSAGGHDHGHGGHSENEGESEHKDEVPTKVTMDEDVLNDAEMLIEVAESRSISPSVSARGEISENSNRAMNVRPRFGGLVKSVFKDVGDLVKKGDALVTIENSSTQSSFTIRSTTAGIVADKRVVVGSFIPENESILRIVDTSNVWFQARIPIADGDHIKTGLRAEIKDRVTGAKSEGRVIYVSPFVDEDTQTCDVRIELLNGNGDWRIGSFAEAKIYLPSVSAQVVVKASATQTYNNQTVIFQREDDNLIATPIRIGVADDEWIEVLSGVEKGSSYVASNSFLAKAELLKSTAAHEH